jgi:hypothetical protein
VRANPSPTVSDLIYCALTVAFFTLALAYADFCDRVR